MTIEKLMTTNSAEKEIPLYVRNILWLILEEKIIPQNEYHFIELDVTVNENGRNTQKITYTNRIQVYQKEYLYPDKNPIKINAVIKVDNSGTATMMLTDELELQTRND